MTTLGPMFELDYSILGGVEVRAVGSTAPIRMGEQVRLLLGRLLLKPGALVTTEAIADALWGEDGKASRRNGVQHAVRAARKALGDTQAPRRLIVLDGNAYRILVENGLSIDAERFETLSACGHELVERNPRAARAMLAEALSAWRGSLLGEFAHRPWVIGHAAELDRLRDRTEVDLNEARLALGEHADLDGPLRRQIIERPTDERLRGQLIRALLAAGRVTEALLTFREAIADLGAVGVELLRLGDQAARGTPKRPSGAAASHGYGGARPGGTVLCVRLDTVGRVQGGPALGTVCLLAAARGGIPWPIGEERLVATFEDPDAALRAARAIAGDSRLSARIGVHVGPVVAVGDRLIGPAAGHCWQLVDAAHLGQMLVSAAARDRVDESDDLRALGQQRFADLGPGEAVFELAHPRGLTFTAPATLSRRQHNLPVQPTRFVGRADDLAALSQRVNGGELVTLTGTSGCGKTRLALQLAAREITRFVDGAWFVGLAELDAGSGVEAVAATIANELGVRALREETLPAAVLRHLSDRAALLVVDNCEQVHEGCAEIVSQLHVRCPGVCIIATSRRRLSIAGETVWAVQPMATDAPWPGALPDAVELLFERAGPLPTAENERASMLIDAARICRALDGLPLAIELAAGQVATRGLAGVAAEVTAMLTGDRPLGQFAIDDPLRPRRHRTIESAIEWSHRLLSECEQRVLPALAVFRGTFGETEARRVASLGELCSADIPAALANLVECSMVAWAPPLEGASRLRLLEPIRAFALGLLKADGRRESAREMHAHVFHELALRTAPGLFGPDEQVCLERLEADHDNLRAALAWYVDCGRSKQALQLVGALWWLWFSRGHLMEGGDWIQRALAIDDLPSRERVRALRAGSHLSWWRGDYEQCSAYNVALEACAEAIDDDWGRAWAPMARGAVEMFYHPREALLLFEESRRRFEALDLPWEAGYALQNIGGARWFDGDYRAAAEAYDEAVEIFERLGHRSALASVQRGAGLMTARCGDPARGANMCLQALRLSEEIGDRAGRAQALNFAAAISRDIGEDEIALRRYADALLLARELGQLWATCSALDGIAGAARAVDEAEIATRLLAHSGRLATRAGYRHSPHERALRDDDIEALRSVLGDEDFERAAAEGASMSVGEAVSCAAAFASRHS
jgi:predicted ATPase/DNA-binding SARP family transcriptional activator